MVETRHFNGLTKSFSVFGTSDGKLLTERFSRVDAQTINKEFTVEVPQLSPTESQRLCR